MISKELLSEVLGVKLRLENNLFSITKLENNITFYAEDGNFKSINIYELAHKCKEWASKSNYSLVSYFSLQSKKWFCIVDIDDGVMFHSDVYQEYAGSEPESIFKACQWILDKKEKQ